MNDIIKGARFVVLLTVAIYAPMGTLAADDTKVLEKSRAAWNEFLSKECGGGQSEKKIRQIMDKKYRDVGLARSNNETYRLIFLVDDYHQIEFGFDRQSKLLYTPTIEPKSQWIRFPNGEVIAISNPEEAALKAKAEEVAIQYVVTHTKHKRDSLMAHCKRSAKDRTWDAFVTLNTLEVDSPTYLLEVTDDGQVTDRPPFGTRRP